MPKGRGKSDDPAKMPRLAPPNNALVAWFEKLVLESAQVYSHGVTDGVKGAKFVDKGTIEVLHRILQVERTFGVPGATFLDLMQQCGEELGMSRLEDERLDEVVPLPVISSFLADFAGGFVMLMSEMGFRQPAPAVDSGRDGGDAEATSL